MSRWLARRPLFPWLEDNRALVGLLLFIFGALIPLISLIMAIDANTRSRVTANELTELTRGSLSELKQQTQGLARQTDSLSQQLDEQKQFSARTAAQLDRVISSLSGEVSHLREQTASLSELVKQGKERNLFAVEPYGWWKRDTSLLNNTVFKAVAQDTIRSNSFAWSAKQSAIAYLTESGIPIPGMQLQQLAVQAAKFHNQHMMYSDFSQTSLLDVLFAPGPTNTRIWLNDSKFYRSGMWDVKFKSAVVGRSDFRESTINDSEFVRSDISLCDFSHSSLINVTFDSVSAFLTKFKNAFLQNVAFLCRQNDKSCTAIFKGQESLIRSARGLDSVLSSLTLSYQGGWERSSITTLFGSVDFKETNIFNSRFAVSPHIVANFAKARIFGTAFDGQKVYMSSLYNAMVVNSSFRAAVLKGINARNAGFVNVSFVDAQIEGTAFDGSELINTDFHNAHLRNVVIDRKHLMALNGAQLSGIVNIVVDEESASNVSEWMDQIVGNGACTADDFVGFGLLIREGGKREEEEGEGIGSAWVPPPRGMLGVGAMAPKCQ